MDWVTLTKRNLKARGSGHWEVLGSERGFWFAYSTVKGESNINSFTTSRTDDPTSSLWLLKLRFPARALWKPCIKAQHKGDNWEMGKQQVMPQLLLRHTWYALCIALNFCHHFLFNPLPDAVNQVIFCYCKFCLQAIETNSIEIIIDIDLMHSIRNNLKW